jgi:hypothetical protein
VTLVDGGGFAEDGDVAVAEVGEVVGAEGAGGLEVEVDAGETGGLGRQARHAVLDGLLTEWLLRILKNYYILGM